MATYLVSLPESISISDSIDRVKNAPNLGLVPKQVKALLLNQLDDRTGIDISWLTLIENAVTYNVYRIGPIIVSNITGPTMAISDGDTLLLKIDGDAVQTITFSNTYITDGAASIPEVITNINAVLTGAQAFLSNNPGNSNIYIRTEEETKSSSIEVTGGTANSEINFPLGIFSTNIQKSQAQVIASEIHPTNDFQDNDGSTKDHYYVQAVSSTGLVGQASVTKSLKSFVDEVPTRTIIYGLLFDAGGNPADSHEVVLRPPEDATPSLDQGLFDSSFGVVRTEYSVQTDEDGYFELEAIAGIAARLTIPSINYDLVVQVPTDIKNFTRLSLVHDDLRINTTTGIISSAGISPEQFNLSIGEVVVVNEDSNPIPVFFPSGETIEVEVNNFPPGVADAATNTKLQEFMDIFDGTNDIGDVTILNTVNIATPSPITVQGTIDVGNFPDPMNVEITDSVDLDVNILSGTIIADIGTTGGLALESTLSSLEAKFVPGNDIGEVFVNNPSGSPIPITAPLPIDVDSTIQNTFLRVNDGGNRYYRDNTITALTTTYTSFGFGFTSTANILANDEDPTVAGVRDLIYSYDGITADGILKKGETIGLDHLIESTIFLRGSVNGVDYRVFAWG